MQPFLLNSIYLILHDRLRKSLFELKQVPVLALRLIAPVQIDHTLHFHIIFPEGFCLDRTDAGLKPRFVKAEPSSNADISGVLQKISHRVIRLNGSGFVARNTNSWFFGHDCPKKTGNKFSNPWHIEEHFGPSGV